MNHPGLRNELLLGFWIIGVRDAAVNRTYGRALLLIEESHTLRALFGHDVIDVGRDRGMLLADVLPLGTTLVDGRVRALRLARTAVDALLGDHRGHARTS